MALFSGAQSFLGIDIGTSSLKLVELVDRRKRIEVSTYAQANMPNILIRPPGSEEDAIRLMANVISRMLDHAQTASDLVIAALPSNVVFSTVITLPVMPEDKMNQAVHFAARDVVPANLDDMVLGYSRVGTSVHMDTDRPLPVQPTATSAAPTSDALLPNKESPVFITAAPKDVVNRYLKCMELLNLRLFALEVETFPLARSLLNSATDSAIIVDLGDKVTTFHLIDNGAVRVSHSIEYGGNTITLALAENLNITPPEAEAKKIEFGLAPDAPDTIKRTITTALEPILTAAQRLVETYQRQNQRSVKKIIIIGGGAKMRALPSYWSKRNSLTVVIGSPFRGLAYPDELTNRLQELGSQYAVAVGLALRGFHSR